MAAFPFLEEKRSDGSKIRTFSEDADSEDLVWHRDAEDRSVRVIASEGWYFQLDDRLPQELKAGDVLFVPKETWHRVIRRSSGRLIVEIVEQ